ncbi:MAG: putative MATE family efflux protein [Acidimicrobiales bacterium]
MRLPRLRSEHDAAIGRLAVPALGTLVAEPLYVLVDTAIVGHLGTTELAGLALASTVLLTLHALLIFLAYGTTGTVSRLIGAGQPGAAAHRSVQSLWLAAGLGVVVVIVLRLFGSAALRLLGGEGAVLEAAETYLFVSLAGFPFMLLLLAASGSFHGRQNTRTPLVIAVSGAVLNLVIELILVPGLGYGVGASALSTVIAQVLTGIAGTSLVIGWARSKVGSIRPELTEMRATLRAGGALVVRTAALRGSFTLSVAVAASIGVHELAAHQISMQLWSLLALALDSVAIAGQALTGRFLGAGDADRARSAASRMIEIAVAVGTGLGVTVLLFRVPLAGLFSDDAAVIGLTTFILVHVAIQQPLGGLVFALDGILIGAGDLAYMARSMVIAAILFTSMAAVILLLDLGMGWLWAAIYVFMAARAVTLWLRWRGTGWLVLGA